MSKKETAERRSLMSRIRTLCLKGRFLEGTVTRTRIGNSLRMTVTDKADGRTRTLFVPKEHQRRVAEWVENWRLLKAALRELSELQRSEFRREIGLPGPGDGAGRRPRRTTRPRSGSSAPSSPGGAKSSTRRSAASPTSGRKSAARTRRAR